MLVSQVALESRQSNGLFIVSFINQVIPSSPRSTHRSVVFQQCLRVWRKRQRLGFSHGNAVYGVDMTIVACPEILGTFRIMLGCCCCCLWMFRVLTDADSELSLQCS